MEWQKRWQIDANRMSKPVHMPERMPNKMRAYMSDSMSEYMSCRMAHRMSELMSSNMPNNTIWNVRICQTKCQPECQDICYMSDKMLCMAEYSAMGIIILWVACLYVSTFPGLGFWERNIYCDCGVLEMRCRKQTHCWSSFCKFKLSRIMVK